MMDTNFVSDVCLPPRNSTMYCYPTKLLSTLKGWWAIAIDLAESLLAITITSDNLSAIHHSVPHELSDFCQGFYSFTETASDKKTWSFLNWDGCELFGFVSVVIRTGHLRLVNFKSVPGTDQSLSLCHLSTSLFQISLFLPCIISPWSDRL